MCHFKDLLIKLTYDHIDGISQLDQAAITLESGTSSAAEARSNLAVMRLKCRCRVVLCTHEVVPDSIDRTYN